MVFHGGKLWEMRLLGLRWIKAEVGYLALAQHAVYRRQLKIMSSIGSGVYQNKGTLTLKGPSLRTINANLKQAMVVVCAISRSSNNQIAIF